MALMNLAEKQILRIEGSRTLDEVIRKQENLGHPIDCIIYDAFLPWALDVAKKNEIMGVAFFTQPCGVNYIYYHLKKGLIELPLDSSKPVSIPGLPLMDLHDMPSLMDLTQLTLNCWKKVVEAMANDHMPCLTIGPTIPSSYLDNRVANDSDYSINLFHTDNSFTSNWLSTKPRGSVVYVAFGSMASLDEKQMEELVFGLMNSNCNFLWVVRASEDEKLPKDCNFMDEVSKKGLIVRWSPQLEILSNEAIGCFSLIVVWNSTIKH
ncbi:hypothetical protein Leryth_003835 [Lithospermum erythrorhizon]|nr:hypothetical protein Leryth_003835 [Lithospermum erythrorhizon]